jgi:ABC-type lipoprotein release transport system permease subunit
MVGMVAGVGLALGIGMTLLGVSQGSTDLFTVDYRTSGVDLYVVTNGGKLVSFLPSDSPGTIKYASERLAEIRGLPGVDQALGVLSWPLERDIPGRSQRDAPTELFIVVGVDGDPERIANSTVLSGGRWVRRGDEIVLGKKLSREKGLELGRRVRLAGRDFTVVGIGRLRGVSYSGDSFGYIDLASLRQRANVGDIVNTIQVDTREPELTRSRISERASLAVSSRSDVIREVNKANDTAIVLRWILVLLTLSIAALFVGNMLSSSVEARRLEFGTLRAIGIPTRTIIWLVVAEALLICGASSAVGIAFSLGLGAFINATIAVQYGLDSLYVADAVLFTTMVLLAVTLGVASGLVPARQAAGVNPIDVLREG